MGGSAPTSIGLWWSTEGERIGGEFEDAEFTLLYGHYARRFWDLVVGVRHEIEPVSQSYLTFGIMGLAPYWFEGRAVRGCE